MITSAADILNELSLAREFAESLPKMADQPADAPPVEEPSELRPVAQPETEAEFMILRALSVEAQFIDNLSTRSGLPIKQVSSTLTILELKGLVRQVGILQYALVGLQPGS
jgi:predicted Rossmann fold nucleotide-binding protein DprA/Smf involved in DNA uptake